MRCCIVGAGLSGAVLARECALAGHNVTMVDERHHLAGNCHTSRDDKTGIMLHVYGPHIFHTDNREVWDYVAQFAEMVPYINRVKAVSKGQVYSLPINLHTINQFFGMAMSPSEAKAFISARERAGSAEPKNFEEQGVSLLGEELYKAFFHGYTKKQWGVEPTDLPASILKRLPVRFNYDDNYFKHKFQGMPKEGYTEIVRRILDVDGIEVRLSTRFEDVKESIDCDHVFYTGPIDRYFDYRLGQLAYRTLDFEKFYAEGDYQGNAVINYCDEEVPYTRITEHKHFAPWELARFEQTVCYREYSRECGKEDIPYYPIRLAGEKALLSRYVEMAKSERGVTFVGRLGTYRYLDMDVTIAEALDVARKSLEIVAADGSIPAFFIDPV